ncbi:MAG: S26 family signal peptidase [Pseudomonadota bacterium]
MRNAALPLLSACVASVLLIATDAIRSTLLIWNSSESLPLGFYIVQPSNSALPGDLVALRLPDALADWADRRSYLGTDALLLKRIAAVAGMTVCRRRDDITIEGVFVAKAMSTDQIGRRLPQWNGCITLSEGDVFPLVAEVANSFDGRYFGSLPSHAIVGRITPLWTIRTDSDA